MCATWVNPQKKESRDKKQRTTTTSGKEERGWGGGRRKLRVEMECVPKKKDEREEGLIRVVRKTTHKTDIKQKVVNCVYARMRVRRAISGLTKLPHHLPQDLRLSVCFSSSPVAYIPRRWYVRAYRFGCGVGVAEQSWCYCVKGDV